MNYKVYYDSDTSDYPGWHYGDPRTVRYKAGGVGKSHKVVRLDYFRREASGNCVGYNGCGYHYTHLEDLHCFSLNDYALLKNRVISKFEGKCGVSSSLGSSIFAEGKESVQLAVQRLEDMANIARAIRRKDIKRLKKVWNKPKRATLAMKQAGGSWLEFSFGWAPLVQTIFDGIAATGADFPSQKVHASARAEGTGSYKYSEDNAEIISEADQFIKLGYDVHVDNPNTWLLGRLDLLNPGTWIWEAIPYSFFVDYFVNIDDMIHNLDSFAGLSFSNGYATYYRSWKEDSRSFIPIVNGYPKLWHSKGYFLARIAPFSLSRSLAWQNNPLTSSWQRGLNASSFLAQRFK